ncbi:MAG: hypothetical protein JNL09_02410 [Anaerolineales bacterium]|nr:hypothetical protein [Anaerolineales bacterium]
MSLNASFYLVKLEKLETLKYVAFKPAELDLQFRELERLGWSGEVILAIVSLLRTDAVDILDFTDKKLSEFFWKARKVTLQCSENKAHNNSRKRLPDMTVPN